jgi:hypothetical protein
MDMRPDMHPLGELPPFLQRDPVLAALRSCPALALLSDRALLLAAVSAAAALAAAPLKTPLEGARLTCGGELLPRVSVAEAELVCTGPSVSLHLSGNVAVDLGGSCALFGIALGNVPRGAR